jgi:threonylcarbamoyladenosine tRNA methylthiotransferase MtaB
VSLSCELLETIAAHEIIGRHLHLPLQSGDDRVLAAMKRRYRNEDFLSKVELARSIIPGINITTDIMVGFPNEDDEAFLSTLQLIEEAGFSHVHVFPFSPRPGTRAWEMSDHVNSQVKRERSQVVRELSERRQLAHREGKLGRLSEVLLESGGRHGRPRGYSSDYTRFSVDQGREGSVVRVMGASITQEAVFGRVVTDEQS